MSVLINSMNIPKSCSDCPLNYDEMSCAVTGTRWWSDTMVLLDFDYTKERLHDCPLSEVPSAQPELIRCKDCKYYYFADNRIPQEQRFVCVLNGDKWRSDDFCSYAERRTDADMRSEQE